MPGCGGQNVRPPPWASAKLGPSGIVSVTDDELTMPRILAHEKSKTFSPHYSHCWRLRYDLPGRRLGRLSRQEGPGQGKHIVFLTGDEEYRSEESLPMLAKILAVRHGFKCTVLFADQPGRRHH